jgi:hypothetical protein
MILISALTLWTVMIGFIITAAKLGMLMYAAEGMCAMGLALLVLIAIVGLRGPKHQRAGLSFVAGMPAGRASYASRAQR